MSNVKPVRVLAAAREDIELQRQLYSRIHKALGARFSIAVANTLHNIKSHPEAMQTLERGIRRWPLGHFPHGVMYVIEETEILVISVFHPRQHPSKWKRRI